MEKSQENMYKGKALTVKRKRIKTMSFFATPYLQVFLPINLI